MARIRGWTKLAARQLWETWLSLFDDEDEAITTAIWIANRLVKDKAPSTQRRFYSVKDEFIRRNQEHLVDGRRVRKEMLDCNYCFPGKGRLLDGEGHDWGQCPKCNGTGVYKTRTLYVHYFDLNGRRYSFHSYQKPRKLSDEPGEDLEQYGGRFTEDELSDLALPASGLVRMLGYVASYLWDMELDKQRGVYYSTEALMEEYYDSLDR